MNRKPSPIPESKRASKGSPSASRGDPTRLRVPRSWRTVTARLLRARSGDARAGSPRREVPEIRLSGEWLARVGFPKGRRYLISVDREIETIYLQADVAPRARRR